MNMETHLVLDKMQNLGMIIVRVRSRLLNSFSVRPTTLVKEEAKQLDDDIEDLLDGSVPFDSIMDSDSEEEEDEVNDLLAKI